MTYHFYDLVGNIGVLMILIAYGALQAGKLSTGKALYHWLNLIGAALILYSLVFAFNLSSFLIEIAWMAISIYGLWQYLRGQNGA